MSSAGRGRQPRHGVMSQVGTWDDVTKGVVLNRLGRPNPPAFFPLEQRRTISALLRRLVALDTEPEEGDEGETARVPLLELVDERLLHEETDGFRYEEMPPDREVWLRTGDLLDKDAHVRRGRDFADCTAREQDELIEAVRTAKDTWHGMHAGRVFDLWLRYACTAFYSHPAAWDEIGFGGPAYPRGYKALGIDMREPFEEQR
ncbi:MAG: gluconate 2-dehydrogenase subunit 3 family protein [Acidimicrobiaceae bacterium]|nr:gluconate 2-dehydrogenase subunit 3 family protein [Acidimicrobiaceae bacterium]